MLNNAGSESRRASSEKEHPRIRQTGSAKEPAESADGKLGHVAVVGRREAVAAFRALGLSVFPIEPGPAAAELVEKLVTLGYRVIFYTEDMFGPLGPVLERYRTRAVPCIVALPLAGAGASLARLRDVVKRAVGADVFGRESELQATTDERTR